jgi:uncharacterized protein
MAMTHFKESQYNITVERGNDLYIFNGISGALLRVPVQSWQSIRKFLVDNLPSDCVPELLTKLAMGRMVIPEDVNETELLAEVYEASRNTRSNFALTIVTSLGCNLDCPYCFEAKHPSIMDESVRRAVLAILDDQLPTIGNFNVTWFGGEPLVGKRPLLALSDDFIDRCDRAGVHYHASIITNGYLLSERTCIELRDRRVARTQVTLDGPPEVHDVMRPRIDGSGSFDEIVKNLHHAVNYLDVSVRINVDTENFRHVERLLQILQAEGFSGRLSVNLGQIVAVDDGVPAPSRSYKRCCFRNREFAFAELEFKKLAVKYGFLDLSLPRPIGTPCTAVRANELVVGSKGELYKCWESVGNRMEVVGNISDYRNANGRLQRWLKYNPFENPECRSCMALPVCMGGCAHHAMNPLQYENRCGTFRHTYHEEVLRFVEMMQTEPSEELISAASLSAHQEVPTRLEPASG